MVPARIGSERLKQKNLELLGGIPIVEHALRKAKAANVFSEVFLNGDDSVFAEIARNTGSSFYLRDTRLGSSDTRSDDVVHDFLVHNPCDAVAWVNSASPLQTVEDVSRAVGHFRDQCLDSMITVQKQYRHAQLRCVPINFSMDEQFARTQDLEPVLTFNYAVMMWRREAFLREYAEKGRAMFCGSFGTFETSELSSILLKTAHDLKLIRMLYELEQGGAGT
jgi:CMP-N-acetylneuraminic acid synthetase